MKDALTAETLIEVVSSTDPGVSATGRVREVSPQANPVTRTFEVRVGLASPPAAFRLGSTVFGRVPLGGGAEGLVIPAAALTRAAGQPAVWVVDAVEQERATGRPIWDAVVEAGSSRVRPIMLTALSTVLGLIPIAPTVFWGPMAFAIMGGLSIASLLTLTVVPTL